MSGLDIALNRVAERARQALWRTIRKGLIALADSEAMLQVDGYEGERPDDVELWQQFGFASRPPSGTEVLLLLVGGDPEHPLAVASHNRAERPTDLEAGEVALHGLKGIARLKPDGKLEVTVEDDASTTASGDIRETAGGDITTTANGHITAKATTGTINLGDDAAGCDYLMRSTFAHLWT